jgi:acetolactate synthase-1/3 small subunit
MKRTLVALVENEPGVLNRVVSLFRRRNFNIDSLTVGRTESPDVSRMTIVMDGTTTNTAQVEKNLYKLINVIKVDDVSDLPLISRDLALVKIKLTDGVSEVCYKHGARIIDVTPETVIAEMSDTEEDVEAFIQALAPFEIIELVRTGVVSMGRGEHILHMDLATA